MPSFPSENDDHSERWIWATNVICIRWRWPRCFSARTVQERTSELGGCACLYELICGQFVDVCAVQARTATLTGALASARCPGGRSAGPNCRRASAHTVEEGPLCLGCTLVIERSLRAHRTSPSNNRVRIRATMLHDSCILAQ